jgi:hypothetical protein
MTTPEAVPVPLDTPARLSANLKDWGSRDYVHAGNWLEVPDTFDISNSLLEAAEVMNRLVFAIRRTVASARKGDPGVWTISSDSLELLKEAIR